MARFVVTRAPGAAWDPGKPMREQSGWGAHAAFMDSLSDERFIAFGGPAGDENRVVLVADAPDEATIHERLALDPWSTAGLLRTVSVDPWTIWLGGDERVDVDQPGSLYLAAYAPGPRWEQDRPRREQTGWDDHAAFIDALTEQRVVVLGGPLDEQRALLVVHGDDEPALIARLHADPWVGGTLTIERLERWTLWLPPRRAS